MAVHETFWFALGVMSAVAAIWVALPLWSGIRSRLTSARARVVAVVTPASIVLLSAALYGCWGSPQSATITPVVAPAAVAHADEPEKTLTEAQQKLLTQAEELRRKRDFAGAVTVYKRAVEAQGMTADAWANYADALASVNGGHLSPQSDAAIDAALTLDPSHVKGLWLKATALYEQHRNADALAVWERLASIVPADSPDAKLIAGNIAEARSLVGEGGTSVGAGAAATAHVSGEIDVSPRLREKVAPGTSLFVFAKAPGAAGPPLAVLRLSAGHWPLRFMLDDSNAMMPQRNLSSSTQVKVEARLSLSGQAMAQSGDLQGSTGVLDPKSDVPVRLVINEVVP